MRYKIAVDTGGTFTDVVIADQTGILLIEKSPTTPERIFGGIKAALVVAAETVGTGLRELLEQTDLFIYGTTRATNAIVQNLTGKTAMLMTDGFPDILVFREGGKSNPHDFSRDYPESYVPRRHVYEIRERIGSEGEIILPLDEEQARRTLSELKERGFGAVGVCLLWSVANPDHELALAEMIEEFLPGVPYSLSHRLIPIVREYRRASATAIDASLKPLMQAHLREMEDDLRAAGYRGEILVGTSVGGCMHVEELAERPIHLLKSGPAMAPIAGRTYAQAEGLGDDVIICDAGGTTFDVGLVRDGELVYTRETWLGGRWIGHIVSMSAVDVRSIGAGGGSIAWVDSGGLLRVGPHSAGAVPGPACYGRGGEDPTVTDAALVLGYIDPEYFLAGRMSLDVGAARRAIEALAARLNQSPEAAAFAVITLVSEHMIRAIHEITINEGFNPRESALIAGGGAAGLNIVPIARELGSKRALVPKTASALSACGMQFSDIVFEQSASRITRSNDFDYQGVNDTLSRIEDQLMSVVATLQGRGMETFEIKLFAEARYLFQVWELDVPLPVNRFAGQSDVEQLVAAFHDVHERVFAVTDKGNPVECLNWRGRLAVHLGGTALKAGDGGERAARAAAEPDGRRRAFFGSGDALEVPVYRGSSLAQGLSVEGPAIIEEPTTTVVVYPRCSARVSPYGNFILELQD